MWKTKRKNGQATAKQFYTEMMEEGMRKLINDDVEREKERLLRDCEPPESPSLPQTEVQNE